MIAALAAVASAGCGPESAVERTFGWPAIPLAEAAAAPGEHEVEGTIVAVAPADRAAGREALVELRAGDAVLSTRAGEADAGERFVVGTRVRAAIAVCPDAVRLRGFEMLDRAVGAEVACPPNLPILQVIPPWPERAIGGLARHLAAPGGFRTAGVVDDVFVPVPCPPGAACKPQHPPHVVVADGADRLALRVADPERFHVGERLQLAVVVCGDRSFGGTVNAGHLVAAQP